MTNAISIHFFVGVNALEILFSKNCNQSVIASYVVQANENKNETHCFDIL